MQNRVQIFYIAIARIVEKRFIRTMNARNSANCEITMHFIINNPVIDGKKIVPTSNVKNILKINKVGFMMAVDITGYAKCYFNKKFHAVSRTFKFLCFAYYLPIISQFFVDCKQNFKN